MLDFSTSRLSRRLELGASLAERVYAMIAEIDGVKNGWRLAGRLPNRTLERLVRSVIVTSTGASNRIEGNRLSDAEVEALYGQLRIKKFRTRDQQEVAGYLEVLESVFQNYREMSLGESLVLQLHRDMLRHSEKDERHAGIYKFGPNRVEAKDGPGQVVGIIFDPTPPHLVPKEMQELMAWYDWARDGNFRHPLILAANFLFEYLAIHPFQDGNGRTSRLLANLILLREGYEFAEVVSHEKCIESRKADYYLALNRTQRTWKTTAEDLSEWLVFFLEIIREQARGAIQILEDDGSEALLSEKQSELWRWARTVSEFSRRTAVESLGMPPRTIESIIKKLLALKKIERLGEGRSCRYRVKDASRVGSGWAQRKDGKNISPT
jgi:Fic family protein